MSDMTRLRNRIARTSKKRKVFSWNDKSKSKEPKKSPIPISIFGKLFNVIEQRLDSLALNDTVKVLLFLQGLKIAQDSDSRNMLR